MWKLEERRGVGRNGLDEMLRDAVSGEKLWDTAERESDCGESLIQFQSERCSFVFLCD